MFDHVGRYRILNQLGKGAMGVVYLADDPLLNRQVAIKTIDLDIDDPGRREFLRGRLLRDARAAAALTHPNIVGVFDVVEESECACIVMEFVEGENLSSYLQRNPVADPQFTAHVIRAMAGALDYTHSRGVIHRDIKPANVMLDAARVPKITDFGIARITEGATTTMTGTVMGTIEYMAPEQVKGESVDGRADQFALGIVAYRMLTGSTLYGEQSMATMAYKIVNEPPAPPRSRNAWLPAAVDPVLAKALAKDPNDRYRNCAEFAEALTLALKGVDREAPTVAMDVPTVATIPNVQRAPSGKSGGSRAAILAAAAAMVVIAGGLAIWKPWAKPEAPAAPAPEVAAAQPSAVETKPPATETKPPATGTKPPATGTKPPATGTKPPATGTKPPATGTKPAPAETTPPVAEKTEPEKTEPAPAPAVAKKIAPKPAESKPEPVEQPAPPPDDPPAPTSAGPAAEAFNRGREFMKNNQFHEAVQAFTKATDIRPNWAQAYVGRGNAYFRLEQFDAALRDYSRAILLDKNSFPALLARAQTYIRTGKDDPALADLSQAIAVKPDAPLALLARGGIYNRRKEFRKAQADFTETIRLTPDNVAAYRGRANARRGMGDRAGAQADQQKAQEIAQKKGEKGGG